MKNELYKNNIEILKEKIEQADAICVGAASGMSASDGKHFWYENDDFFYEKFGDFHEKYGFTGVFNGFYHPYKTEEARWAFIARMMHTMFESTAGDAYINLMKLLKNKNYFVVTTNQDMLFHGLVPEEKLATIQGDWNYLQCGGLMEPWVRGYHFLEGTKYREEYEKWNQFLLDNHKKKILFLELGVGRMTPMFIQEPFWNMTYSWENAYYISINPKHALLPEALENKGIVIHEDIRKTLADVNEPMKAEV